MDQIGATSFPSVCLVHSPCTGLLDDRLEHPMGLLYLASTLREFGSEVRIEDLSGRSTDQGFQIPPGYDVYGFSTYSVNFRVTCDLARDAQRQTPSALVIAGGPHATALPEQVLDGPFDLVIAGEAETAILDLMHDLMAGRHPRGILAAPRPEPLDRLPFPAFDLVDLDSYSRRVDGSPSLSVLTSRGCPHRCTFCNSNIMGAGKELRFRSVENVVAELRWIKQRFGIRHIRFQDDIFTADPRRLSALAAGIAGEEIVYRCFARVTGFTKEVARLLAESGCRHVSFGVESGSPKILGRHAMNKGQTPAQIRAALENARAAGLRSRIYLMVGFPGETDDTVHETLRLVKDCPWDEFSVYPLIAYPGTPLHDRPEDFGITRVDRDYSNYLQIGKEYRAGFTIRTMEFDEYRVRGWRDRMIAALRADGRIWSGDSAAFR